MVREAYKCGGSRDVVLNLFVHTHLHSAADPIWCYLDAPNSSSLASGTRRQASRNAAKFTEDGRIDDKRTGQLPAFEQAYISVLWQHYPSACLHLSFRLGFPNVLPLLRNTSKSSQLQGDETFLTLQGLSLITFYKQAILAAAQRNLERWKESALSSVAALVEMERDFVTAAFFRHAVAQRSLHMQQLEQMHDIMDSASLSPAALAVSPCVLLGPGGR